MYAGQNGANDFQGNPPKAEVVAAGRRRVFVQREDGPARRLRHLLGAVELPAAQLASNNYGQTGFTVNTSTPQGEFTPTRDAHNPFPNGLVQPQGNSLGLLTGVGTSVNFVDQNKGAPRVQQYSVDSSASCRGNGGDRDLHRRARRQPRLRRHGRRDDQHQPARSRVSWRSARRLRPAAEPVLRQPFAGPLSMQPTIRAGQLLRPFRSSSTCSRASRPERAIAITPACSSCRNGSPRLGRALQLHLQPTDGQPVRRDEQLLAGRAADPRAPAPAGPSTLRPRSRIQPQHPRRAAPPGLRADLRAAVRPRPQVRPAARCPTRSPAAGPWPRPRIRQRLSGHLTQNGDNTGTFSGEQRPNVVDASTRRRPAIAKRDSTAGSTRQPLARPGVHLRQRAAHQPGSAHTRSQQRRSGHQQRRRGEEGPARAGHAWSC